VLIFGYGNPGRGDDVLGPLLLDYIARHFNLDGIELLSDFQLQIEHALDLADRELVLFADSAMPGEICYKFYELLPEKDRSYTSHAMTPQSVLDVYTDIHGQSPPASFLLSIMGETFELGEGLSPVARQNLLAAKSLVNELLAEPEIKTWRRIAEQRQPFRHLIQHK